MFSPDSAATGTCLSTCDSDVASGSSLMFNQCPSGVNGGPTNCLTTTEGIYVSTPISASSIGTANFLTVAGGQVTFSLLTIATYGTGTSNPATPSDCAGLATGQSCVIYPGAALLLTLLPNNETLVSLSVTGMATDNTCSPACAPSAYQGGFSQTLTQALPDGFGAPTPQNIQLYFCGTNSVNSFTQCDSGTQSITSSQSGSFTATAINGVPEPNTLVLLGIGGILIGATRFKRSKV